MLFFWQVFSIYIYFDIIFYIIYIFAVDVFNFNRSVLFDCSGGLPISVFFKMLVNAVEYGVTVAIFNNQKFIVNLRFELPSCSRLSNNLPKYDPNYISLLFYIFLSEFLFSKCYVLKNSTKSYISIFLLFNILLGVLVWLCSCLIILSGTLSLKLAINLVTLLPFIGLQTSLKTILKAFEIKLETAKQKRFSYW